MSPATDLRIDRLYLVDTNGVNAQRKGDRAHPGVVRFFRTADPDTQFVPVQTHGELRKGMEIIRLLGRPRSGAASSTNDSQRWCAPTPTGCAQKSGRLMAQHPIAGQIAAIALLCDMTVVARNTSDVDGPGACLLNPFVNH